MFTIRDHYNSVFFNQETLNCFTGACRANDTKAGFIGNIIEGTDKNDVSHNLPSDIIIFSTSSNIEELNLKSIEKGIIDCLSMNELDRRKINIFTNSLLAYEAVNYHRLNMIRKGTELYLEFIEDPIVKSICKLWYESKINIAVYYISKYTNDFMTIVNSFTSINKIELTEKESIELVSLNAYINYRLLKTKSYNINYKTL